MVLIVWLSLAAGVGAGDCCVVLPASIWLRLISRIVFMLVLLVYLPDELGKLRAIAYAAKRQPLARCENVRLR